MKENAIIAWSNCSKNCTAMETGVYGLSKILDFLTNHFESVHATAVGCPGVHNFVFVPENL